MSKDVECPYCGYEQDINHDDEYGYSEDETYNQQCGNCDNHFVFTTSIHFYYNVEKADCLNGSEHKYKPTITTPKCFTKMVCSICGDCRTPSLDEAFEYGIPTYAEYLESIKETK